MKQPVIFCDFDGTVTDADNIIAIMKKFAPPEWIPMKDAILDQQLSIKEGVANMFSLLPVSAREEITSFVLEQARIREGFSEFVQYTRSKNIPLYIVSGGIDFFVNPLLEPYGPFAAIYCNEAEFSGENIKILFPHACDDQCTNTDGCGCCKPSIMRTLLAENQTSIVIGDSITDLQAAKQANLVIARDFLIEKCEELQLPYEPFENFLDVIQILEARLGVDE